MKLTMEKDHLNKATRLFLNSCKNADNAMRINAIKSDFWIGYKVAKTIQEKLQELIEMPRIQRMWSYLIVGTSENGKTSIRLRIEKMNERYSNERSEIIIPVASFQMPSNPNEKSFLNSILRSLLLPTYPNGKPDILRDDAIRSINEFGVRLLIIDEIQHIGRMPFSRQRLMLDLIKYISNEARLPIAAFGTEEAINIFSSDPQLKNRFKKIWLPGWEPNDEYRRLLASFELILPLSKPSVLIDEELALLIYDRTNGTIGEISMLIKKSAIEAIKMGVEKITKDIVKGIDFETSKAA